MEFSKLLKTVFVTTALMTASAASNALVLNPGNADYDGNSGTSGSYGPSNCEPACINDLFGTSFAEGEELYKIDFDDKKETGDFESSYEMSWKTEDDEDGNPEAYGGLLSWIPNSSSIVCDKCYVAVKDGQIDPRYYFFNISSSEWNGTVDLEFSGFWIESDTNLKGKGSISHISIWGNSVVEVPEPGTLALFGMGIIGLTLARRKNRAS